jgi:hypothetical protein
MVEPMKDFLAVSRRKQQNQMIGLVNHKEVLWLPLQNVNNTGTINDVKSMSGLDSRLFESQAQLAAAHVLTEASSYRGNGA